MADNSINDKWLIVYQGTLDNYKRDSNKDSYKNKMVLVTGDKTATGERDQTSYLCIDDDTHSVNIPIPAIYLRGIGIGKNTYGFPDSILKFASANGINVSFSGGAVTIGINNDTLGKIDSIDNKVEQTAYNDKVAELEASIGGKYTKPAEGIPEKDLAFKVATETEVVNAISKAAADLNDKIDNKISKTDTLPAENVGSLSYGAKGLASTNPIIANRIPYLKADAFAFLQPEDFTVEVKYNDEVNWLALDNNNADMRGMFAQWNFGTGFPIDGSNTSWKVGSKIRITLAPKANRNAKVDFVALNVYANGRTFDILTEYYDSSPSKEGWYSVGDSIAISSNGITFVKYDQYFSFPGYYRKGARFTFTITHNTQYGSKIVGISGFGNLAAEVSPTSINAPYTLGTLWYWDYLKNVYFPNEIYEGGISLKNKYASISKIPSALPNPESLTYKVNGVTSTYNGSSAATIQIFTPTTIGSQGQLLQSMGGGAPQWTNLSAIKEAIGFAKDLTGVLEATPEEFTFRPSAGNKSIRDEGAVIRRIKGNTTVWGQCCKNPYLELDKIYNKGQSNASYTNTDGGLRITYNSVGNPQGYYLFSTLLENLVKGHIYMVSIDARVSSGLNVEMELYPNYDTVLVFHPNEEWHRYAALYTLTRNTFNNYYYVGINKSSTTTVNAGDYFEFRNAQFIDLTNIFGAGNEPQTYEDFNAIYPDIYPYCEPEIRNVKTTAIETVGFNLFNGEYADLIGGKTYYIGGTDIGTLTFTPNGTTASEVIELGDDSTYTPLGSGKIYSTGTDVCVHFQHSGIKDGECADYVKHTLELPEIAKYFPDGMNGIGKVYDEINAENAVTRFGVLDLGSLDWGATPTVNGNTRFYSDLSDWASKPLAGSWIKALIKCAKYDTITSDDTYSEKVGIALINDGKRLQCYDPIYTDPIEFKASMNGVMLVYELAEPIIRPILEPIQLVYDVEDFGTERAISIEDSAPFRADIVYQFNAEGRIRDNGRNIEKLENKIRSYHDDGVMVTIDREIITTKSIIGNSEFRYALPDAPQDVKGDADGTLATEFWVQQNIPTEVATAMMKESLTSPRPFDAYNSNIVYEFTGSLTELTIQMLIQLGGNYDHVWIIRFGCSSVINLSITPKVYWKDGIEPIFGDWGICELKFHTSPFQGEFLGEWKIYR